MPDTVQINASVPPEVRDAIVAEAQREDRTVGAQVRRILSQWVIDRATSPNVTSVTFPGQV